MPSIYPSSVFLAIGGAKGITAQCVIKLAKKFRCKWILLGRSEIDEGEPAWAKDCFDERELKRRIMRDLLSQGKKPSPKDIRKKYEAILSGREIRETLYSIEQAGSQAVYLCVDVTDASKLQKKLFEAAEYMGTITGIIHGAGNIKDKLIERKTERDFEDVYGPKVRGLENLLNCISPSQLQYLILFSSVAGFYGNVGQADYSIANEILNKTAHLIKSNYPACHVVAINWGPWEGGMVNPEFSKIFSKRDIDKIPIEIGTSMLLDELSPINLDAAQVMISGQLGSLTHNERQNELRTFRIHRTVELKANPFLQHYVISGSPVMPATVALAWLAHGCEQLYLGYNFFECKCFKVLKEIVFDRSLAKEYVLDCREINRSRLDKIEIEAEIWGKDEEGKLCCNFSAQLTLAQKNLNASNKASFDLNCVNLKSGNDVAINSGQPFYQNGLGSLFHGSSFQGVKRILTLCPEEITLECTLSKVEPHTQGQFPVHTINPYILDVQTHSVWLWLYHFHQQVCFLSEIEHFEIFAKIPFEEYFYVSCQIKLRKERILVADVAAYNCYGQIYSLMIGLKTTTTSPSE